MPTRRKDLERAGLPLTSRMTVHAAMACPVCGAKLGASDAVSDPDASPAPEDLTLCANCGAALIFTAGQTLRIATQAELDELPTEATEAIARAQRWVATARNTRCR